MVGMKGAAKNKGVVRLGSSLPEGQEVEAEPLDLPDAELIRKTVARLKEIQAKALKPRPRLVVSIQPPGDEITLDEVERITI
jgi:hypothetical protein